MKFSLILTLLISAIVGLLVAIIRSQCKKITRQQAEISCRKKTLKEQKEILGAYKSAADKTIELEKNIQKKKAKIKETGNEKPEESISSINHLIDSFNKRL